MADRPSLDSTSATPAVEIDAYLATLPDDKRAALEKLRAAIRSAAPDAEEAISYGVPAFKYRRRPLVSYAAAKEHCSLFVMSPSVLDAHRDAIGAYDTSKGTIRFPADKPLPDSLVATIVRARMAETDAAAGK